jgi:hypothetical protein
LELIVWKNFSEGNPEEEILWRKFCRRNPVRAPRETDALKKVDCLQEIS